MASIQHCLYLCSSSVVNVALLAASLINAQCVSLGGQSSKLNLCVTGMDLRNP